MNDLFMPVIFFNAYCRKHQLLYEDSSTGFFVIPTLGGTSAI